MESTGLAKPQTPQAGGLPDKLRCRYCGAVLRPEFYFCASCATPYKPLAALLPVGPIIKDDAGTLIQKNAPYVWPMFWTFAAVLLASSVIAYFLFGSEEMNVGSILLIEGALFVTTLIFAVRHWPSLSVQFKCVGFHWAALAGLAMLVPMLGLNYLYHEMFLKSYGEGLKTNDVETIGRTARIVFLCICPAIVEEIAFRGLIQHWLQVALKPWLAIVLASALFAAMHVSLPSFPYLFLVGGLLGWTKWKSRSLYPSMLIHFLHNFVVLEFFPTW